jgi:DNA segregation ATPase FtsK/SpoIIIE-like protein
VINTKRMWAIPYKNELIGFLLCVGSFFLAATLFSYNSHDISWFYFHSSSEPISNWCGALGANIAALLLYLLGGSSLLIVSFIMSCGILLIRHGSLNDRIDRLIAALFSIGIIATLTHYYQVDCLATSVPGGLLGMSLHRSIFALCGAFGGALFLHVMLFMCLIILIQFSFMHTVSCCVQFLLFLCNKERFLKPLFLGIKQTCVFIAKPFVWLLATAKKIYDSSIVTDQGYTVVDFEKVLLETTDQVNTDDQVWHDLQHATDFTAHSNLDYKTATVKAKPSVSSEKKKVKIVPENNIEQLQAAPLYQTPTTTLFQFVDQENNDAKLTKELEARAKALEEKLERFGVSGKVVSIKRGPVVTLFEYQPTIDTKVSKIVALEDDLALALQAMSIRIMAPIPGKSVVGFEVANKLRKDVFFSSVIHSQEYTQFKGLLPLILGEDTIGNTVIVDLTKMPHLLVAGSTGSGKSVALNAMLISLLCKRKPDELKLILIDPKRLEFAAYADIAHLLFPIITDARRAVPALRWAVQQMEERYMMMAQYGARTISDYNAMVGKHEHAQQSMSYIVIVIDELADLMMTASREIEDLIARIAQMARACGIHMIVATQRPSVDVITGLIKVNFPSRISFRVTSKIDSRTILDSSGADKLLGRGDMLFLDAGGSFLRRVHGAYVNDKEIESVIAHIRAQQKPIYLDLTQALSSSQSDNMMEGDGALYADILKYLVEVNEISISLLQRKFRIGFNRSARIIDLLEAKGKILPADGSKTRKVIK